ncbi:uncharacterized protein [Clytia hemisphaerica]|uniref:uncharacterized protein n=1 Tax=Clytia hemisphaerica TaxID=252671 RepID=UPI0034D505B4
MLDLSPAPAKCVHLCMYAAYLARFLLPQSVCIYLNIVGLLHREMGFPNPLLDNFFLSSVLKGIKRSKGVPPVPKLPITVEILSFIHSQLNLRDSKQASFWALCLVSFFGLFRKSHLLPVSQKDFSPDTFLTRDDFTFLDSEIHIRALSLTPGALPCDQAFCWRDSYLGANRVFVYRDFMYILQAHLSRSGLSHRQYGSHSFRRGGATFALEAGVPLDSIAVMGDWKSDAMYLYLHMPLSQRLHAQHSISSYISSLSNN